MYHNFEIKYTNPIKRNQKNTFEIDEEYNFDWAFSDYENPECTLEIKIGEFIETFPLERYGYMLFSFFKRLIKVTEGEMTPNIPFKNCIPDDE